MQTITALKCKFEDLVPEIKHADVVNVELRICQKCSDGLDRLAVAVLKGSR